MPKPRVYVETTIPSFYHEARSAPDIVARREWTRQWWEGAPDRYDLVTSPAVLDELTGGIPERSAQRLALVRDLPLLPIEPAIAEIVQAYIRHRVMPADPALGAGVLSQMRLSGNMELPALGKCEQIRPHSPRERVAWSLCAGAGDALGTAWR